MNRRRASATPWLILASPFLWCAVLMLTVERPAEAFARQGQTPAKNPRGEMLSEPRTIEDVPCKTWVRYSSGGALMECVLSAQHTFGSVTLPANSWIQLRPDRSVADVHLGQNTRFDGHTCRGSGPDDWMSGFYPDGRLRYCFLASDETIDGVPCRKGSYWGEVTGGVMTEFHANGRLRSCRLTADYTAGGKSFRKGQRIRLDEAGKVIWWSAK